MPDQQKTQEETVPFITDQMMKLYENLPAPLQEALTSTEIEERVKTIGTSNNLHLDTLGALYQETALVLLGVTPTEQFVDRLEEKLDISREQARQLGAVVDEEIFSRVRDSLKTISERGADAPEAGSDSEQMSAQADTHAEAGEHFAAGAAAAARSEEKSAPRHHADAAPAEPEKARTANPMRDKLAGATRQPAQEETGTPAKPKKPSRRENDPYREPIE